jgi:hypothetical protein
MPRCACKTHERRLDPLPPGSCRWCRLRTRRQSSAGVTTTHRAAQSSPKEARSPSPARWRSVSWRSRMARLGIVIPRSRAVRRADTWLDGLGMLESIICGFGIVRRRAIPRAWPVHSVASQQRRTRFDEPENPPRPRLEEHLAESPFRPVADVRSGLRRLAGRRDQRRCRDRLQRIRQPDPLGTGVRYPFCHEGFLHSGRQMYH